MADNPWHKHSVSPWVLMVGSGEIGDFWENYEGFGVKSGRSVDVMHRPMSVASLIRMNLSSYKRVQAPDPY